MGKKENTNWYGYIVSPEVGKIIETACTLVVDKMLLRIKEKAPIECVLVTGQRTVINELMHPLASGLAKSLGVDLEHQKIAVKQMMPQLETVLSFLDGMANDVSYSPAKIIEMRELMSTLITDWQYCLRLLPKLGD